MNVDIHSLLATKDFQDLNSPERQLVLKEMSQEQYEAQRKVITASQEIYASPPITPRPDIRQNALKAMKKKPKVISLLEFKIPAWAAVAACLLVVWVMSLDSPLNSEKDGTLSQVKTPTSKGVSAGKDSTLLMISSNFN